MTPKFNDEWKIWIWTNVASGQDKHDLFKIMLEAGFAYTDICSELNFEPEIPLDKISNPLQAAAKADHSKDIDAEMHQVILPHARKIESDKADLYIVDDFLNPSECEELIRLIKSDLSPSTVVANQEQAGFGATENRTSSSCNFFSQSSPLVSDVESRICNYLGITASFSERLQGQFYEQGQEFKPHFDYFPEDDLGSEIVGPGGQRTMTCIILLNDVAQGGHLEFPNIGQSIEPRPGRMVVWNNLYASGKPNPATLHAGALIKQGTKAIVTKWFRANGSGSMVNTELLPRGPAYTPEGFKKAKIPEPLFKKLRRFHGDNTKSVDEHVEGYITGDGNSGSMLQELSQDLRSEIHAQLLPLLEQWSGIALKPTVVYGIRTYLPGAQLAMHRDRSGTHIVSVILNIAQDVDEDWPLHIEDHFFRRHSVTLSPGEMLFYEGGNLAHGRPAPFKGDRYSNIFAHYAPKDSAT